MKVLSLYSGTVQWNDDSHSKAKVKRICKIVKGIRVRYTFEAIVNSGDGCYEYHVILDGVHSRYECRYTPRGGGSSSVTASSIQLRSGTDSMKKLRLSAVWPESSYTFDMLLEADWEKDVELDDEEYAELTKGMM